jgi:hypothetical protein
LCGENIMARKQEGLWPRKEKLNPAIQNEKSFLATAVKQPKSM